jgi:uncharacterized protein (TIGR02246 family)
MRKLVLLQVPAAVMFLLFSVVAKDSASESDADATKEVIEVARQFQAAAIRNDPKVLTDIFADGITHFHAGSPYRFTGKSRLVNEFSVFAATAKDSQFEMIEPQVQMASSDIAILTYYINESWTEQGTMKHVSEKASEVYVKRDGRWRMIHSHYSVP